MRTLYISDLDGTLLQPNVELSKNTIRILNELIDRGMLFSVATARSIASIKHILKDVSITSPVVLMNGVCIYDLQKDRYIQIESFSAKSVHGLMTVIKKHRLKGLFYAIKDGRMSTYYEDLNSQALKDFCQERIDKYQKKFTQVDDFISLSAEPLIYFTLLDKKEKLEQIHQEIVEIPDLGCTFYKDNYSPDLWYLETFSKSASKYHAVQYLRSYLDLDNIVCFGDNRNDLPLFEASNQRLAVGNAVAELKEKADEIIGCNTEDGVANWLLQHVSL